MSFKDQTGAAALPTLTPQGEVPVSDAPARDVGETNRLLRKLIAGLELVYAQEFPEVE